MAEETSIENLNPKPVPAQEGQEESVEPSIQDLFSTLSTLPELKPREIMEISFTPTEATKAFENANSYEITKGIPLIINLDLSSFVSSLNLSISSRLVDYLNFEFLDSTGKWQKIERVAIDNEILTANLGSFTPALRISKVTSWGRNARIHVTKPTVFGFTAFGNPQWQAAFGALVANIEYCRNHIESEIARVESSKRSLEDSFRDNQERLQREQTDIERQRDEWNSKLSTSKAEQSSLENSLTNLRLEKANFDESINKLRAEYAMEEKKYGEMASKTQAEQSKLDSIQEEAKEKSNQVASLAAEIARKQNKLAELNRDISLFAVDLQNYGTQGSRQARTYGWFLALCIVLGLWVTDLSLNQVNEIWQEIVHDPQRITWSLIFIARMSIFLVYSTAIGALLTLATMFVRRIVQINDGARRLSEISIVARDVTEATLTESDATPEQRDAVFFAARMILIRDLLSGTFERLSRASKKEKVERLEILKSGDLVSMAKILKALRIYEDEKK